MDNMTQELLNQILANGSCARPYNSDSPESDTHKPVVKVMSVDKRGTLGFDLAYHLDLIQNRWGYPVLNVFDGGKYRDEYDIIYVETTAPKYNKSKDD